MTKKKERPQSDFIIQFEEMKVDMKRFENTINQWQYKQRYLHALVMENEIGFYDKPPGNGGAEFCMRWLKRDNTLIVYCFPSQFGIPAYPFAYVELGKTKMTNFPKIAKLLEKAMEVDDD